MKTLVFSLAAITLLGTLLVGIQGAWSDDDHAWSEKMAALSSQSTDVAPVTNSLYREECGACHLAYPAGLLPVASWQQIMKGLADHFGENAELDDLAITQLNEYLQSSAADRSNYRRSRMLVSSLQQSEPVMRITEIPYFRDEHDEIPGKVIALPGVGSLSHCNNCHRNAEKGSFSEHDIWIKGIGRWDD